MMESTVHAWLQMQCMMISEVVQGFVLHPSESSEKPLTVQWPHSTPPPPEMTRAAEQVLKSCQGHLSQKDKNEIILSQPIQFADQLWGSIVLRMAARSDEDIQATRHLLQWGQSWLQLLLYQHNFQQPDSESEQPNVLLQASTDTQALTNAQASTNKESNTDEEHQQLELLQLLSLILLHPGLEQSASTLVNALASRFVCNRVSFGLTKGHTIDLIAVSNSAHFDQRTHSLQRVIDAMMEAVEQRQDLHLQSPINTEESDHQLQRNHELLRQENNQGGVHTLLLRNKNQVLGALTIEENPKYTLQNLPFLQQLIRLLTPLFEVKQQASAGLLQQGRKAFNTQLQHWFGTRHALGKYIAAGLSLFIALLFLPAEHWVGGKATLESTVKRVVAAPQDGYILATLARPGTEVKAGDTLAQLDNRELLLEQRKWSSQLRQYQQEYDNALANYDRSQASILNTQVEQARIQLQLIEEQLKRSKLLAPIGGLIVSDDISQSLGAPVKQGQILFEVAPLNSYRVKLYVNEREILGLAVKQSGRLILSSLPGETFDFSVTRILPLTEVRDGQNFFQVEGQLSKSSTRIRPGMTGSGKVLVGKRSLGWLWFHDIIDWLRLTLWL